uniref:GNAT family N-acetyltransferase n=1 Tax=Enterobacter sp. Sphag71 TaxID=2587032 RepID=UPI00336C1FCA
MPATKGYATEFARTVIAYGFDECQLPVIDAAVRPDHFASQRVLEKAGLRCYDQFHDVPGAPASLLYELRAQTWRDQGTPK